MELAFQSTETIEILEWHIIAKYFEYQWGIPLHIQQSINKFIPIPPKLARSHFSRCPNIDISVSINELIFLSEEFKEALEININNRIINQKKGIPNFIQASLNSFIPPVPPGNDFAPWLQPGERSNTGFRRSELTKINTILSTDQIFCACTVSLANSENDKVNSCVDNLEEFSVSPKLESKNKMNSDVTKQSFEIQSVYRCSYSATSKSLLKLNTPYRRLKKQNLKSKWGDDCFEVEYPIASPSYRAKSMKTVGSSTWTTDQKLADLTYKPMTIVGLSLGPAMIEANVSSSPMIVQDFNVYVKQNMGSAFLSRPVPYADCEEILSKNSRDIDNDVPCSEELTQEEQNHIQENERHGYVKIVAGAIVNNQNEEQKAKVDLSEINCAQSTPTKLDDNTLQKRIIVTSQDPDDGNYLSVSDEELHAAYCENLNKSYHTSRTYVAKKKCKKTFQSLYSSQTKPDKNLMKSKAKFSKQDCQRPRTIKHKKEGTKSELSNENILLVRPPAEPCRSETDQKEKSSSFSSNCGQAESPVSTREASHSCRHDERPSQSSTANSLGCQQASSHEESSFATNKDCEVYYQCESPLLSHTKQ
ncbi:uncharacterized protein LOC122550429 [Chiloscyllium plagiosum]|uniref:uncharacterized protein LOC122550429 n=1 Tax=Chiloscyllium plagiosum TaxID=36176 RepID=UPI001CB881BD|nr:uncharacterized protein LOC122550429 [Chiloscyllium plagiosum]XP_043547092.1 uncharacterized protein LOC122550429 [Chiloscyllium plagiosum]